MPLQKWANSPTLAIFWAAIGCICSLICPLFLGLEDWPSTADVSRVRMLVMLLSCTAAAGAYRAGYLLRHRGIMRDEPTFCVMLMEYYITTFAFVALFVAFFNWGTWPNVVGLELLFVAVFVLVEMARPILEMYTLFYLYSIPISAGLHRHGWDFFYLGWPMLTVPLTLFLIGWRITMRLVAGPALARV